MQRNTALDFRVGLFVLIGVIILAGLVLFIGDFRIFQPGYNVKLIFGFANGIKESAPVRMAGVNVGQIKRVNILFDEKERSVKVGVEIWVKADTRIPQDSVAEINTLGILGEKYIEIDPGEDFANCLKEGDTLIGQDPISLHDITSLGKRIALQLDESISKVNEIVGDETMRSNLKSTILDLRELADQIQSGKGTLGKLIYDRKLYDELEDFVADIKANPWKLLHRDK